MTIERIIRLRDHGVFRDFLWPTDLTDFGRYNLVYGWNGSGKTTLSRLLRDLELRRVPAKGEVQLRVGGGELRGADFPQASLQIRVFNRDFIQESVFPVGGGDVPPIFVVGTESVEKQKEADRLKTDRTAKEQECTAARAAKQAAEREFDRHCTESATAIRDALRSPGANSYNNYDKRGYQARAQQMTADGDGASCRLIETERDQLLAQQRATPKPKVPETAYRLPELQRFSEEASATLSTTVVSAAIQALRDDASLSEWVRQGLGLHKDRVSGSCLFCLQSLPPGRLPELEAHFNAEFERFLQKINEHITSLEAQKERAIDVPARTALYDNLAVEFDAAELALRMSVDTARAFIGDLVAALADKRAQPFAASALGLAVPTVDPAVIDRVNTVIRKHNDACDAFDNIVRDSRDRLARHMIATRLDDYIRLRDAVQSAVAAIAPIESEVLRLSGKIDRLEREIVEHRQPAEELNKDLRRYLGHGDIQLAIKDSGYSITRNGVPADLLSEGEMSALALLYFLKALEDRGFDKGTGVVVLDDPVSSLDGNALFLAFSLIRERTRDAAQVFLITHDFMLFRQARNWLHYLNRRPPRPSRFYMLECLPHDGQRTAVLQWIDPLLEQFESEYHYLFACIYRLSVAPAANGLEAYYHIPNVARRLLEGFLAFKVPQASGDLHKALQIVDFDESKKNRLLRFLHTQSHGADLVPGHDPTVLGECPAVLNELLELMRALDDGHVSAMLGLTTAGARGGTTNGD